jgi:hypothetical protein
VILGAFFRNIAAIALLQAGVDTAVIALWLGTPMPVTRPHRHRRERPPESSASVTGDTGHRHGAKYNPESLASVTGDTGHRHGAKYNGRSSGRSLTRQSGASCPTASNSRLMTSSAAMPRVH